MNFMFDQEGQGLWKKVGWIPPVILLILVISEVILGLKGTVYNQADLAFVLQLTFVLGVSILLSIISARAYLVSGSFNILLLGIAALISGVLLIIAQWGVTPSLISTLTTNESVTIGNIGILAASVLLFISAILLWFGESKIRSTSSRKSILGTTYLIAILLIVSVTVLDSYGLFPVFFMSGISTTLRMVVLACSGFFLAASCLLFGWKYQKTKSPTLYWYTLGLGLFFISIIGIVYFQSIGDLINWSGRIGLYLMGLYFLLAVLSRDTGLDKDADLPERWANAFSTDRKQITTFFSRMLNGFVYGKIITDQNGKAIDYIYLDVNSAFEKNHGLKKEEIIGKRVTEVLPGIERDPSDLIRKFGHVALTEESADFEACLQMEKKWFHYSVYSPEKGYFISTSEDITDRKEIEENLRRSNAELQQFAYVASHDLQEPLRMVTAYLSLIEKKYGDRLDGDAKQYLDFAVEGGLRAKDLVRDLLEVSRVDSQAEPMSKTDINDVMDTVCNNLTVQIGEEHAVVTRDSLPIIMADKAQIVILFQNLVSNAIKFHGDREPKVHVSGESQKEQWLFSVKDNGIGIDPQFQDKIFVIFQRLNPREEYEGTGIGLAIAKKIVERHGGKIWFDSQVGQGTTFYFTIPKGGKT